MKTSKRDRIITGALKFAHRNDFDTLIFDALTEHVGLTRGGVTCHFHTKTELLGGIAVTFQERWRTEMLRALGKPLEETNRTERIEALAHSVLDDEILPGEISFILSSMPQAETTKSTWNILRDEWIDEVDELSAMQHVALLAVDGWWTGRAVNSRSRSPDEPVIAELIMSLARGEASDDERQ